MLRFKLFCVLQFVHYMYKRMILQLCYMCIFISFFVIFVLPSLVNKALCVGTINVRMSFEVALNVRRPASANDSYWIESISSEKIDRFGSNECYVGSGHRRYAIRLPITT